MTELEDDTVPPGDFLPNIRKTLAAQFEQCYAVADLIDRTDCSMAALLKKPFKLALIQLASGKLESYALKTRLTIYGVDQAPTRPSISPMHALRS